MIKKYSSGILNSLLERNSSEAHMRGHCGLPSSWIGKRWSSVNNFGAHHPLLHHGKHKPPMFKASMK